MQAEAYASAWRDRESRQDVRTALLRFTTAHSAGVKKRSGGTLTLADFLPDHCKPKPEQDEPELAEMRLKARLIAMAAKPQPKPPSNG